MNQPTEEESDEQIDSSYVPVGYRGSGVRLGSRNKRARDGKATVVAGTGAPGLTGSGGPATKAEIQNPDGLALGRDGTLYVSEHANNRIRKIDTHGVIATIAGKRSPADGGFAGDGGSATAAQLRNPRGIVVDAAGNVYFSDEGNHRVRRIDTHDVITTVFGPTT